MVTKRADVPAKRRAATNSQNRLNRYAEKVIYGRSEWLTSLEEEKRNSGGRLLLDERVGDETGNYFLKEAQDSLPESIRR